MKRLWKSIPPCLSDVLGLQAVVSQTNGLAVIDDPSRYKPLRTGAERPPFSGGRRDGRAEGRRGSHGGRGGASRVVNSDIRNEDIILGTQQKVVDAAMAGVETYAPNFILLSQAPSSAMIGTDLAATAEIIASRSGLPTACVDVQGDRDYIYGISRTLETMGRLLLREQSRLPGTVNLLGCNAVDWHGDTLAGAEKLAEAAGCRVLSRWGVKESTENLKRASAAGMNWVVHISGLRLARYMEEEFGIPFAVGAPFGAVRADDPWFTRSCRVPAREPAEPEVLVVGEQLMANAIRCSLERRGRGAVRVLSVGEMEKAYMRSGDRRLTGEEELAEECRRPSVRLVLADGDLRAAAGRELPWIPLPNGASMSPIDAVANFNMAGAALDTWLDSALEGREAR